jgi:anti-sigma B factor antagonist
VRPFDLEHRDVGDGYLEIEVFGELDMAVADRLDEAIAAVSDEYRGVVVGLAGCELVDSAGIAVMLRAHRQFAEEGRRLVVCCPRDQAERVLAITGLMENGLVFESLPAAVAGAEPGAE